MKNIQYVIHSCLVEIQSLENKRVNAVIFALIHQNKIIIQTLRKYFKCV